MAAYVSDSADLITPLVRVHSHPRPSPTTAYQRPSFELKLRRNAWAAGAPLRTPIRELKAFPRLFSSIEGPYF